MAKQENLKLEGKVVDVMPSATFRVEVEGMDKLIVATVSGKMRKHNIKVMLGDRVEVEVSVYDLLRGRIVRRR